MYIYGVERKEEIEGIFLLMLITSWQIYIPQYDYSAWDYGNMYFCIVHIHINIEIGMFTCTHAYIF